MPPAQPRPSPPKKPLPLAEVALRQSALGGGRGGAPTYAVRDASIDGRRYARALLADLAVVPAEQRRAEATVWIGRRFARFAAIAGRDDGDAVRGPGLAVFEVYGDGRLLWRSDSPIGSVRAPVKTAGPKAPHVRTGPLAFEVSVAGVERLRLVARYAAEVTQEAPGVVRALGCAWADARLYPAGAGDGSSEAGFDAALASALLRLGSAALWRRGGAAAAGANPAPLRLAVAPLPDVPRGAPQPDRAVRDALSPRRLGEAAGGARLGTAPVFRPLDGRAAGRFERDLRRPGAVAEAAARAAGADALLVPLLRPPTAPNGPWAVELRLSLLPTDADAPSPADSVIVPVPTAPR
jgi:hypothetical protein